MKSTSWSRFWGGSRETPRTPGRAPVLRTQLRPTASGCAVALDHGACGRSARRPARRCSPRRLPAVAVPLGDGRRHPLPPPQPVQLRRRRGALPPGLVHDEVQPADQRGPGGADGVHLRASSAARLPGPGHPRDPLGTGTDPDEDHRHGGGHPPAGGGRPRGTDRDADDPQGSRGPRRTPRGRPGPRFRPRHQPGDGGVRRLPRGRNRLGSRRHGRSRGPRRGDGRHRRRRHADRPQHPRDLRTPDRRDHRNGPRSGRFRLPRRRQPQRLRRPGPARADGG